MATAQQNLARFQEIARRGLQDKLPEDKRARFDEAVRRGLITTEGGGESGGGYYPEQSSEELAVQAGDIPYPEQPPADSPISALKTHDGLPAVANEDGSFSTEVSVTVTDPRLNGGRPTNIPSLWGGRVLDEDQSVANAVASGKNYPSFESIGEAVEAAKEKSNAKGSFDIPAPGGNMSQAPPGRSMGESAGRYLSELGEKVMGPANFAINTPPGRAANEFARGVSQGAVRIADLFTTDVVNHLMNIAGSDKRTMTLEELLNEKIDLDQPVMEPGTAQETVNMAGQFVGPSVAGGAALRQIPKAIPQTVGPGSVTQNVARQLGVGNAGGDALLGAASGAGSNVGREVGGDTGALIGGLAAPMAVASMAPRAVANIGADDALPPNASKRSFPESADEAAARKASDATGVDLLPAQRSLDPQKLRAQRFLPELSPTAQKASKVLARQNKQASDAVDDFLAAVAPEDAVVRGPGDFRSAAQRSIKALDEARKEATKPLYDDAFREAAENNLEVDMRPIRATAARILEDFPEKGQVAGKIRRVLGLLSGTIEREVIPPKPGQVGITATKAPKAQVVDRQVAPSLQRLHGAKVEIDQMMDTHDGSIGRTTKAMLRQIRDQLIGQMEEVSPGYIRANQRFAEESIPYENLKNSVLGKTAKMDDTQLKNISRRIFDPGQTDRTSIQRAKQVIDEADPEAWNLLLRSEMERRIGSLKPEVGTSFENMPSKLKNAIFGTGKNRDAILAGMGKEQRKNAELLEKALERASLGRPGGSETAGRGEFLKDMGRGGVVRTVKNWLRSPVDEAVSVGDDSLFDRRAKALADVLFDPAYAGEATKALKDPTGKSFGYLLYQASEREPTIPEPQEPETPQVAPQPAAR